MDTNLDAVEQMVAGESTAVLELLADGSIETDWPTVALAVRELERRGVYPLVRA